LTKKKIILIDGNNIAYRAFYALPQNIATSSGTITNAVYGFTTMLIKLIDEQNPTLIIALFDSKKETFRHKIYAEYKANRKKMPNELFEQFLLIKEVLDAFHIPSLELDDFEADDLIATIAQKKYQDFDDILIVSSDKDILQLVDDKIKVMALKKGITDTVLFDQDGVKEKFGIGPKKLQDLLSLTGDSSDNIPGVSGIGPKTALSLISQFGSLEGIYENIEKIKSAKLKETLIQEKGQALKSKELVKLVMDVDIDISGIPDDHFKDLDYNEIVKTFESLEFKTLKDRVKRLHIFHENISADKELESAKTEKRKINLTVIDEGFDSSSLKKAAEVFLSLCFLPGKTNDEIGILLFDQEKNFYFLSKGMLQNNKIREKISFMEDEDVAKSGYDCKRIYKFFKRSGITLQGDLFDLKVIYLLLNASKTDIDLPDLLGYLGINNDAYMHIDIEFDSGKGRHDRLIEGTVQEEQLNFDQIYAVPAKDDKEYNEEVLRQYLMKNIGYLDNMEKIKDLLLAKLEDEQMLDLYHTIEEPLISVLGMMELKGIHIDRDYLKVLIRAYDKDIKALTSQIYAMAGEEFNINSPQQLAQVLFVSLKLQPLKKTKTGFSTNAQSLLSIYAEHPIIEKILDYREKVKLKNTYIDVIPNLIDPLDGRLHTTYHQLGTSTGRMSSSDPNLQNIPVRTELGRQIRKAFIPGAGYDLLITADYSQIELRILAHMSKDAKLIDIFNHDGDIHTATAAQIFGVEAEEVDEDLRRKAKAINFGIIYGMTEYGLKIRLAISEEEARDYIKLYFERYPSVKAYINSLIKSAYEKGYSETLFKRRRYINELGSSNARMRSLGERLAVNAPIQGSAADIMKLATIKLQRELEDCGIDANILLQVHDELVLELKEEDYKKICEITKESMEKCVNLDVKLKIDIKSAKSWYI
jgi:DNA polymerase I